MGHAIEYFTTDKRSEIISIAEEFAWCNVDRQENHSGSYHGRMTIHDNIICESYNEAVKKIESLDRGFYDDHAVRYKDKSKLAPNKTMLALEERMKKNREDKIKYAETHSFANRKSEFMSCPECKSKLAIKYLRHYKCPVCGTDMRADYIVERFKKYDEDYKEMELKYQKMVKERKGKCKTKWLFKVEVHC